MSVRGRGIALVGTALAGIVIRAAAGALPWTLAGVSLAFPVFVGMNPEQFAPPRLAVAAPSGFVRDGVDGFASLAPLIDRSAPRPGEGEASGEGGAQLRRLPPSTGDAPWLDSRPVGAIPRPFRVRAVAGGSALIVDDAGTYVVAPGEVLPSGARLVRALPDGTIETRP